MARALDVDRQGIGRLLATPFRGRTYRRLAYLALMFPLGVIYFTLLSIGFGLGLPLVVLGVGVPIVLATLVIAVELTAFERLLVGRLLGVDVPAAEPRTGGSIPTRSRRFATDWRVWRGVAYLTSVFAVGSLAFGLLAPLLATAGRFLLAPLYYRQARVVAYGPVPSGPVTVEVVFGWDTLLVGLSRTFQLGSWEVETLPEALAFSGAGVLLFVLLVVFADAVGRAWSRYAEIMLPIPRYWSFPGW